MSLEFLGRLQKELSITGSAVYESVLAISERVNRKVHILRLHGQAATLLNQLEAVHTDIGRRMAAAFQDRPGSERIPSGSHEELAQPLNQATERIRHLKHTLLQVDSQIRDLKLESIHEDLLTLQRDLTVRSAALERFVVAQQAPVCGKPVADLGWPSSIRIVTIFRGPFLVPPNDSLLLRQDDIVIVIGLRADLDLIGPSFAAVRRSKSA